MNKVAIILATFNGAEFISGQLATIIQQIEVDLHIFVRDDNSTDNTVEIIRSFVNPKLITFIGQNNFSASSPIRNFLKILCEIDVSLFDYICFCDQDDIWLPDKIINSISLLKINNSDCYSSDLLAFDSRSKVAWYIGKSDEFKEFDYLFQGASAGCTYLLNRKAALLVKSRIHPFMDEIPPNKSHDWLVYAICRSFGLRWFHDLNSSVFYRQHSKNAFGALPSIDGYIFRLKMARSGWYRDHVLWLENFLSRTSVESEIFDRLKRLNIFDRFWFAFRCMKFRRRAIDALMLSLAILTFHF